MWWKKKLTVPICNETAEITTIQVWEVRWESRHGYHCLYGQEEMQAFYSQSQAEAFATSLRNAFALLRYKPDPDPNVRVIKGGSL